MKNEYTGKNPITILEKGDSRIIVDPLSEFLVIGTQIDYIKEDYTNGIYESKFIFNPDKKLVNTCGCGISFSFKDNNS